MDSKNRLTFDYVEKNWLAESVILMTVFLTFGVFIHRLGLYGSQWAQVLQPELTAESYGISGVIQTLLIRIIGTNVIVYHLINAILFCVIGIMIYRWLIGHNESQINALSVTLLFLVFPGFSQSTGAFTLTTILIGMLSCCMSLLFFIQAKGDDKRHEVVYLIFGILCALAAILLSTITSIFEALVVAVFLIFNWKKLHGNQTATGTGLIIGSLIIPFLLQKNSIHWSLVVMISAIRQWLEGFLIIWRTVIILPSGGLKIIIYLLAVLVLFILLLFVFRRLGKEPGEKDQTSKRVLISLMVSAGCGFVLIVSTGVVNSKSSVNLANGMGMAVTGLAVSFFLVALIQLLFLEKYQSVILALVIVLAGGARYQMIDRFAKETKDVNNFLSQLQARADGFKPGTSLLVEQLPFNNTSRDALQALIRNRFGIPQSDSELQLVPAEDPSVREFLINAETDSFALRIDGRQMEIEKSQVLAVFTPQNGCMEMLEPGEDRGEIPYGLKIASKYSNTTLINVNNLSDVLQLNEFRTTIDKDICYESQLIHRFAAQKSWEDIVNTYKKMPAGSLMQDDMSIGKPVLRAMIHTGDIQEALNLTNEMKKLENFKETICPIWTEALTDSSLPKEVNASLSSVIPETGCP